MEFSSGNVPGGYTLLKKNLNYGPYLNVLVKLGTVLEKHGGNHEEEEMILI